ncbi:MULTISPECIES: hypothetical protein [Pseudomonas]|uniref:hypothetical protein n=1 Tax=Pseudomonas TaxID=286 RepID=UPI000F78CDB3|nr:MULTISPECIES: hypothetical protein [Pseudomonas]MCT5016958.1 hypothetical protein [Pseudomonas aeruginosa]UZG81310.1 hypothetical protein NR803_034335 [Pseudomonas aeruginosa]WBW52374.1 hypothetical protein IGGMDNGE_00450 [Pseudomonas aeruginosa]WKA39155.1 hypothetical protein QYE79_34195 [Pseudomonas aeruginosa]
MKQHDVIAISFAAAVFCTAVGIGLVAQNSSAVNLGAGLVAITGGALNAFYFMRGVLHRLRPSTSSS